MVKKYITKFTVIFGLVAIMVGCIYGHSVFAVSNYNLSENYTTVLQNSSGINRNVRIDCYNTNYAHTNDVIMLNKSGKVVWQENGAIPYSGSRTFWCGRNVCKIRVKISVSNPLGWLYPRVGSCNVY